MSTDRHILSKPLTTLVLPRICTVEKLVAQLQPLLPSKYVTVVNGTTIITYDSLDDIPLGNRCLEPNLNKPSNQYYVRDHWTNNLICCFDLRVCERLLTAPGGQSKRHESSSHSTSPPTSRPILGTSISPSRERKGNKTIDLSTPIEKVPPVISIEHLK